eukprot:CAMPEP_0182447588 /NCGR_PEP_ID=MMETSP1172-20130603/17724_1 /TAXON_ID=708627 /ORGANISM="Timspurckia oligopyrenoides, Strain CCMP3278" /LENGTH=276 /DNA_ID=CAMNT_0024644079 /DNA_START=294 /DNA_END=1120 /DNA_ORIENTATION=-
MSGVFDRSKLMLGDVGLMLSSPIHTPRSLRTPSAGASPKAFFNKSPSTKDASAAKAERSLEERFENLDTFGLVSSMRNSLTVRDHLHGLKLYQKTFVGQEAIKWMIQNRVAENLEVALFIGGMLYQQGLIYDAVRDDEDGDLVEPFKAGYHLYRFSGDDENRFDADLWEHVLSSHVVVRDRRQGLKKYPDTFLGLEAVQACLKSEEVKTRAEAKEICQKLIDAQVIEAAVPNEVNDRTFVDGMNLYRFVCKRDSMSELSSPASSGLSRGSSARLGL